MPLEPHSHDAARPRCIDIPVDDGFMKTLPIVSVDIAEVVQLNQAPGALVKGPFSWMPPSGSNVFERISTSTSSRVRLRVP